MVEDQICKLDARLSALVSSALGFEIKACTLPKAVKLY
jgi:hypothetical protein